MIQLAKTMLAIGVCSLLAACNGASDKGSSVENRDTQNQTSENQKSQQSAQQSNQASANRQAAGNDVNGEDHPNAPDKLFGTWVSIGTVDAPVGRANIRVTFNEEGPARVVAWSTLPLVGEVKDTKGPYRVEGNKIISDAIQGGSTVQYRFEGDNLVIQYEDGKTLKFKRQS